MDSYTPPIREMMFILGHVVDIDRLPHLKDGTLDREMIGVVLTEGGRLAADILAPLNHSGDRQGCILQEGTVTTPDGFREAYAAFRENGWNAVPFDPAYGGQGLPWVLTFALQEMWQSANMAFGLCPLLTQAGIEALHEYGTDEQKNLYLVKMISGEWTGSMQLTEPQAGTDLGALRCKSGKQTDGSYKLTGSKIFITYGEHDFTENIVHMVLARTPDAPEGSKGISMFLVPKFIPDAAGNPGQRNDVKAVGLEHKMGIHAAPTCTMQFGDKGGATGWLIGAENEGLKNMFIMMNNARLCVGLQGVALAERAYQLAFAYANERVQGTRIDDKSGAKVKIAGHPDVKRMLLSMKAQTEAGRALALEAGVYFDLAKTGDSAAARRVNLLTPLVKAWCTDMANDVAALGVQVHGGMGFIEETGAAQYVRDARILTIYEGTNGVQAQDLFVQKLLRDKGQAAQDYFMEVDGILRVATAAEGLKKIVDNISLSVAALKKATAIMLAIPLAKGAFVSVSYLKMFGTVAGAVMLLRVALAAKDQEDRDFYQEKRQSALFYALHILPCYKACLDVIAEGSDCEK